jgi:hypothetical protein
VLLQVSYVPFRSAVLDGASYPPASPSPTQQLRQSPFAPNQPLIVAWYQTKAPPTDAACWHLLHRAADSAAGLLLEALQWCCSNAFGTLVAPLLLVWFSSAHFAAFVNLSVVGGLKRTAHLLKATGECQHLLPADVIRLVQCSMHYCQQC